MNQDELSLLIIHLVRCPEVIRKACDKQLEPQEFYADTEYMLSLLWDSSKEYFKQFSVPIPKPMMVAELTKRLDTTIELGKDERDLTLEWMETCYAYDASGLHSSYGIKLLEAFLMSRRVTPIAADLHSASPSAPIPELVQRMAQAVMFAKVSVAEQFDINMALEDLFVDEVRIITGLHYFDVLLNGGLGLSETIGVIGPTGGGKSTIAQTLAVELAGKGRKSVLFLYEEAARIVWMRLLICAAKVDRTLVENRKWADIDDETRAKLETARTALRPFVDVVDMSGSSAGMGGIPEIRHYLQEHPGAEVIIIDHVGPMVIRMLQSGGGEVDQHKVRLGIATAADQFRILNSDLRTAGLIFNQVNAEAQQHHMRAPSHIDAAECKSFANNLQYCFCLGKKDPNGIAYWVLSKARGAAEAKIHVHVDGKFCRVRSLAHKMTASKASKQFEIDGMGVSAPSINGIGPDNVEDPVS